MILEPEPFPANGHAFGQKGQSQATEEENVTKQYASDSDFSSGVGEGSLFSLEPGNL